MRESEDFREVHAHSIITPTWRTPLEIEPGISAVRKSNTVYLFYDHMVCQVNARYKTKWPVEQMIDQTDARHRMLWDKEECGVLRIRIATLVSWFHSPFACGIILRQADKEIRDIIRECSAEMQQELPEDDGMELLGGTVCVGDCENDLIRRLKESDRKLLYWSDLRGTPWEGWFGQRYLKRLDVFDRTYWD